MFVQRVHPVAVDGQFDRLAKGELVAEIETDRSVMEIEAPCAGILNRIDQPVGAVVATGARIGRGSSLAGRPSTPRLAY